MNFTVNSLIVDYMLRRARKNDSTSLRLDWCHFFFLYSLFYHSHTHFLIIIQPFKTIVLTRQGGMARCPHWTQLSLDFVSIHWWASEIITESPGTEHVTLKVVGFILHSLSSLEWIIGLWRGEAPLQIDRNRETERETDALCEEREKRRWSYFVWMPVSGIHGTVTHIEAQGSLLASKYTKRRRK